MKKSEHKIINISTHNHENLYFAVGVSNTGKILMISLPQSCKEDAIFEITKQHPQFRVSDEHSEIAKKVCQIYHGQNIKFELESLELNEYGDISNKTSFEREVLIEVSKIPHGEVKTYKDIAESINSHAYRAVGTAIGKNPFPLVIPCHRVIRSDHQIGGYRGGTGMKMDILKNEGIKIKGLKIVFE